MGLALYQEKIGPSGNIVSKGILNQLGRPDLDILAILVREAVQNSWDARKKEKQFIDFDVNGWTLTSRQKELFRSEILVELPPHASLPLADLLNQHEINVMMFSDHGTTGLTGPTRADKFVDGNEEPHFINFLRNIGNPSNKEFSGGTYGYGKSAFYRASQKRTICVYTRCIFKGKLETRFIISALGHPYETLTDKYTGRYWWGQIEEHGGLAEPILNEDADWIADALGFPSFDGDETGTSVMILDPYFGERTPLQATNLMAEYILWNFWPKMLAGPTGFSSINFDVIWQGTHINIPKPEEYPPLIGFVQAMHRLNDSKRYSDSKLPSTSMEITSQRPKQRLGHIALQQFTKSKISVFDTGDNSHTSSFNKLTHHTAVMRQPELVVRYIAGPQIDNEHVGYAGVFVAEESLDRVFAESEPPTHDDWVYTSLEDKNHRSFVNQAMKRIKSAMSEFVEVNVENNKTGNKLAHLGSLATKLTSLLMRGNDEYLTASSAMFTNSTIHAKNGHVSETKRNGENIHSDTGPIDFSMTEFSLKKNSSKELNSINASYLSNSNGKVRNVPVNYLHPGQLIIYKGHSAIRIDFELEHFEFSAGSLVQVNTTILVDGNQREATPPMGVELPTTIAWVDPNRKEYPGTDAWFVSSKNVGICSVIISVPTDAMLKIDLKATTKDSDA